MTSYVLSLGQSIGYKHPHPDRTAVKNLPGTFGDLRYQVWPSRASMAKTIRTQQKREYRSGDWKALVPLTDGEGHGRSVQPNMQALAAEASDNHNNFGTF